jgi:hypothetical protein
MVEREAARPWVWVHWGLLVALPLVGVISLHWLPEPVVNSFMFVGLGRRLIQVEHGVFVLVCLWIAAALLQWVMPKGAGSPVNIGLALAVTTLVFGIGVVFSTFPRLPRLERHHASLLGPLPPAQPLPGQPIARCKHLLVCTCPQGGQTEARDCEGESCEAACRKIAQARTDAGA